MKKKFKKMILTPMLGAVSIIPPMVLACGPSVDYPDSKDSWEIDKEESIAFAEHKNFSEYDVIFDGTIGVFDKRSSFGDNWNANGKKNVPSETIKNTYKVRVWNGYEGSNFNEAEGGDLAKAIRIQIYNNFYKEKLWYPLVLTNNLRKTFPKEFKLPNKLKVLAGEVMKNSNFSDGFTLQNTKIEYISRYTFANSKFGKGFRLPKSLKYMDGRAFEGYEVNRKGAMSASLPEYFHLNSNFIGFIGNANHDPDDINYKIIEYYDKNKKIPFISKEELTRFDLYDLQLKTDFEFYPFGGIGKDQMWRNDSDAFEYLTATSSNYKYKYSYWINSNKGTIVSRDDISAKWWIKKSEEEKWDFRKP